jgi:hypothetical protein
MRATDDEDIPEYINKMKSLVENINAMQDPNLEISDKMFSEVLMQSLPPAWDQFVDSLHHAKVTSGAPVPALNIVQLMRHLKDDYYRRVGRKDDDALHGNQQSNVSVTKRTLTNWISGKGGTSLYCKCCKKSNHSTDDCRHLGKALCTNCGCFGHMTDACWRDGKAKRKREDNYKSTQGKSNNDNNPPKKGKYSNVVEEEESAVSIEHSVPTEHSPNLEEEMYKFYEASDIEDCVSFDDNEITHPLYIECLPDSGTTSHVFHKRDMFIDYRSTDNLTVGGVGGN